MKVRRVPTRLFPPFKGVPGSRGDGRAARVPSTRRRMGPLFGHRLVEAAYRACRDSDPQRTGLSPRQIHVILERSGHTFRAADPYMAVYSAIVGATDRFERAARGSYRWIAGPEDGVAAP